MVGKRGFTLIELLVVIAIIGMLSALLTPMLGAARRRGRTAVCMSNLRQAGFLLQQYVNRHGHLPHLDNREHRDEDLPSLDTEIIEQPGDERIYRCPADEKGHYEQTGCSYFWNILANGQHPERLYILGMRIPGNQTPLVVDKEGWHRELDDGVIVLYADGHVAPGLHHFPGL